MSKIHQSIKFIVAVVAAIVGLYLLLYSTSLVLVALRPTLFVESWQRMDLNQENGFALIIWDMGITLVTNGRFMLIRHFAKCGSSGMMIYHYVYRVIKLNNK